MDGVTGGKPMSINLTGISEDFEDDEYGNEEAEHTTFRVGDAVTWILYGIIHEHPWDSQIHGWGPFRISKVVWTSPTKCWTCSQEVNYWDHHHQGSLISEREQVGHRQKILITDTEGKLIPRVTPLIIQGSVPGELRHKYFSWKWFKKVRNVALFQYEAALGTIKSSAVKNAFRLHAGK